MKRRMGPAILCSAHGVDACVVCMVEELQQMAMLERELREQVRAAHRPMPVEDQFDFGGSDS